MRQTREVFRDGIQGWYSGMVGAKNVKDNQTVIRSVFRTQIWLEQMASAALQTRPCWPSTAPDPPETWRLPTPAQLHCNRTPRTCPGRTVWHFQSDHTFWRKNRHKKHHIYIYIYIYTHTYVNYIELYMIYHYIEAAWRVCGCGFKIHGQSRWLRDWHLGGFVDGSHWRIRFLHSAEMHACQCLAPSKCRRRALPTKKSRECLTHLDSSWLIRTRSWVTSEHKINIALFCKGEVKDGTGRCAPRRFIQNLHFCKRIKDSKWFKET